MGSQVWNIKGNLRNALSPLQKHEATTLCPLLTSHSEGDQDNPHLNTRVAGGHGLHVERCPDHGLVCPEGGLGGPGPVPLPSVGPHTEQVLSVVL